MGSGISATGPVGVLASISGTVVIVARHSERGRKDSLARKLYGVGGQAVASFGAGNVFGWSIFLAKCFGWWRGMC